jgi:endonuclease/exonuclease/phosphatase family metal-dependent hydrolase
MLTAAEDRYRARVAVQVLSFFLLSIGLPSTDPPPAVAQGPDKADVARESTLRRVRPFRIRVLTYNIHHGQGIDGKLDLERIARVILSVEPDLVTLQEVDRNTQRTLLVDQPAELARLTKMHVVFGDNIAFQGGQYGNAVLSQFSIRRHENHALPTLDQGEQRGVLEAEVELPDKQSSFLMLATHLDHRRNARERIASAVAINNLIARRGDTAALLAGDLNAIPGSTTLVELAKQWKRANEQIAPTIPVGKPTRQIDYVMFRPVERWKVVETKVLDEAVASDHRAVLAVLDLQSP